MHNRNDCPRTHHHGLGRNEATKPRHENGTTRRRFIRNTALGTAGLLAGPKLLLPSRAFGGNRLTKIVRTHHDNATTGWDTVNQGPVNEMVHAGVKELTGIQDLAEAWKSLFPGITVDKKVSIKINLACGDVPTHPEVVNAIIDGLLMMDLDGQQLPEEHIIVWDLDNAFFCPQTGYPQNWGGPGVQYVGTDHGDVGFDFNHTFYIDHPNSGPSAHHPSSIITKHSDYMINAAVIKDHSDSAVTFSLKNHYGSFDNISIWQMHVSGSYGDGHTRGEPELNRVLRDELGDKTKLWLVDATFGLYDGGPGYTPPWHTPPNWAYNSFLCGLEPVALDWISTIKLNEERANHGLGAVDPSHVHSAAGAPYNLGTDDIEEIDFVELDVAISVDDDGGAVAGNGVILFAPRPNPAHRSCMIRFHCEAETVAEIAVFDVRGALVRRIAMPSQFPRGTHRFRWDGKNEGGNTVPSGVYFARVRGGGLSLQQRIVIAR